MVKITPRVLVVLRKYPDGNELRHYLESFGCHVDFVNERLGALKFLWTRRPYQLLIIDVVIDEISGLALHMLAKKKNPLVKTIALNDRSSVVHNVARQFGIDQVMDLPVDKQSLCVAVQGILEKYRR